MIRWLVGLFFIVHGFVHGRIWLGRRISETIDPRRSWLFARLRLRGKSWRTVAPVLAAVVAAGFMLAGIGWFGGATWSRMLATWSAAGSLLLIALYFNIWLSAAVLMDLAILYLVRR